MWPGYLRGGVGFTVANGASNRVLRLALTGKLPVVCHYKLLSEYREVLFRMVMGWESEFSRDQVERLLAAIVTAAQEVEVRYLWRPNLADEGSISSTRRQ